MKSVPEKIREVVRNHTSVLLFPDVMQQIAAPPDLLKKIEKETAITAKAILSIIKEDVIGELSTRTSDTGMWSSEDYEEFGANKLRAKQRAKLKGDK